MEQAEVVRRIVSLVEGAEIEVEGEDCNFSVIVVSPSFSDQSRIQRQQSILGLFSEELSTGDLHALSVRAYTPSEWKDYQARQNPVSITL